jgi:hypothetical protein
MTFTDELNRFREKSRGEMDPELKRIIDRSVEDLSRSEVTKYCLQKGRKAPDFVLPNAYNEMVSFSSLISEGPLVLSFYRGGW